MNRIQFIKRLLASIFGAVAIKQTKATVISSDSRNENRIEKSTDKDAGNIHPDPSRTSGSAQPTQRYLLSATVAGTPYYDFPAIGSQLLAVEEPEELDPDVLIPPSLPSFKKFSATLRLEPDNEFDFRAIEVYWRQYKMGYIPRAQNKVLYNLLKDGATLVAKIRVVSSSDRGTRSACAERVEVYREPNNDTSQYNLTDYFSLRIRVYLQEPTV